MKKTLLCAFVSLLFCVLLLQIPAATRSSESEDVPEETADNPSPMRQKPVSHGEIVKRKIPPAGEMSAKRTKGGRRLVIPSSRSIVADY